MLVPSVNKWVPVLELASGSACLNERDCYELNIHIHVHIQNSHIEVLTLNVMVLRDGFWDVIRPWRRSPCKLDYHPYKRGPWNSFALLSMWQIIGKNNKKVAAKQNRLSLGISTSGLILEFWASRAVRNVCYLWPT